MVAGISRIWFRGEIIMDGYSMSGISPQERPVVYLFQGIPLVSAFEFAWKIVKPLD